MAIARFETSFNMREFFAASTLKALSALIDERHKKADGNKAITHRIVAQRSAEWGRQRLAYLAREAELNDVFPDCELGAVPGFGQAYRVDVIWDDDLGEQPSVFFEAGDHEELIEIDRDEFHRLFDGFPHGMISQPSDAYLAYHSYEFWGDGI